MTPAPGSIRAIWNACCAATGSAGLHDERKLIRCPFHEDRGPSLSLMESWGTYHCFGCGVKGGCLDLPVQFGLAENLTESSRWLSERGLIRPADSSLRDKPYEAVIAPRRYTTRDDVPDMLWWLRTIALHDLDDEIGKVRLRAVRDHVAEMRYKSDGPTTLPFAKFARWAMARAYHDRIAGDGVVYITDQELDDAFSAVPRADQHWALYLVHRYILEAA